MNSGFKHFLTKEFVLRLPDWGPVLTVNDQYYLIPSGDFERKLVQKTFRARVVEVLIFIILITPVFFINSNYHFENALFWSWFILRQYFYGLIFKREIKTLKPLDLVDHEKDFIKNIRKHTKNSLPVYEVSQSLYLPDSTDKIIMMKYDRHFPNLFRFGMDGSLIWQAELPTRQDDVYTNVQWDGENLLAYSLSCFSVSIDKNTGKIISS